ncbi:hypothetical protein UFOVP685_27 [uncultured Caudovirales phage]|uniref:Uncharacterized protein n=1 Tax=uncultured Caudovirales phage TaxID=2100421 RepID=A0A6J5N0D5_9CAUD|nr:hypothetical protein UFOVP590_57 [uncultured Caudovirales phage]CAB4157466.1 hypothetical protein UFOVP685_27 [uncultured Caudovirales phage]CAB5225410.1 hypothetical protein UFOVP750_25 [uncultured Caudovirales phage]
MLKLTEITLYDLMAEDLDVWIKIDKKFGFNLQIDDENGDILIDEEHIHPCAADSFANFCRRYLACYDRANQSEVA